MKVVRNTTGYPSRAILKLARAVARRGHLDPGHAKQVRLTVRHIRKSYWRLGQVSGKARLGGVTVTIRLPHIITGVNPVLVAWLLAHEFAHLRGLRHRDFHHDMMHWTQRSQEMFSWAADYQLH